MRSTTVASCSTPGTPSGAGSRFLAEQVDGEVAGDTGHPGVGVAVDLAPSRVRPSQGFLGELLGQVAVAQDPERHAVGDCSKLVESFREGEVVLVAAHQ